MPRLRRDYQKELATEKKNHPERVKLRALRNAARRRLMKEGLVRKGDDKDVDHITPLSKGGRNSRKNLRVRSSRSNASYKRTRRGAMRYLDQR